MNIIVTTILLFFFTYLYLIVGVGYAHMEVEWHEYRSDYPLKKVYLISLILFWPICIVVSLIKYFLKELFSLHKEIYETFMDLFKKEQV